MTFKHQHSTTMQLQNQQQMSTEWGNAEPGIFYTNASLQLV